MSQTTSSWLYRWGWLAGFSVMLLLIGVIIILNFLYPTFMQQTLPIGGLFCCTC